MGQRPRILHVSKLYSPYIGGVESVLKTLAKGLGPSCDQDVLVCQPRGPGSVGMVDGIRVHRASSLGIWWSMPVSFSYPFALWRMAGRKDLVHLHHPFPLGELSALAFGRRVKTILTWYSSIVRQRRVARIYRPALERILDRAEAIILIYPGAENSSELLAKHSAKCHVIPPGIEAEEYDLDDVTQSECASLRAKYGAELILYAGRLVYYKGLQHLIEAMPNVRGTLLIAGDGPLLESLKALCKLRGVSGRVHFLGRLDELKFRAAIHACDVFVLPSTHSSEAFGLVQLEAMACRKPVVNTNVPTGVSYVSRHGETGLTVEAGNPQALSEALNMLLQDAGLRRVFGENGRQRVEREFSARQMVERTYKLYEKILAR